MLQVFVPFLRRTVPLINTGFREDVPEPVPPSRFALQVAPLSTSLEFENLLVNRITSESDAVQDAQRLLDVINDLVPLLQRAE